MKMKSMLWMLFLCIILLFSLGNTQILPFMTTPKTTSLYPLQEDYLGDTIFAPGLFSTTQEGMGNRGGSGNSNKGFGSKGSGFGSKGSGLFSSKNSVFN